MIDSITQNITYSTLLLFHVSPQTFCKDFMQIYGMSKSEETISENEIIFLPVQNAERR